MTIETMEDTEMVEKPGITYVNLSDLAPYYTISPEDTNTLAEEQKILEEFTQIHVPDGKKVDRALTVMRAKPFHRGHRLQIEAAGRVANEVVVGIGSANKIDPDNPFSPEDTEFLIREGLKDNPELLSRVRFVNLDDVGHDEKWGELTEATVRGKAGDFDVVIGNSGWVKSIFENRGKSVFGIESLNRAIYKGEIIRADLRKKGILAESGLHRIRRTA